MEVNLTVIMIWILFFMLGICVSLFIQSIKFKKQKNKFDGIIIIDEADEYGHAGMSLEFNIEYDELMKRDSMIFEIQNHLLEDPMLLSQNSQFVNRQ